jgi:hypothetical protein
MSRGQRTQTRTGRSSATGPEKKIGPYPGGIGVAVWVNNVQTDRGPRKMRSVTISPRRYRDPESGEWRDATSFRPGDLPALIFALQKAQEHILTTPLDGDDARDDDIPY